MPDVLFLTAFPLARPRAGGPARAAMLLRAARLAGWRAESLGLYPAAAAPPEDWGAQDIVLDAPGLTAHAAADPLFAAFHLARAAARDAGVVATLRAAIARLAPQVIHLEEPWLWPVLREALPPGHGIRLIYASPRLEAEDRLPLLARGLRHAASAPMLEATRLLEEEVARVADLVFAISAPEAAVLAAASGRPVIALPPAAGLPVPPSPSPHGAAARLAGCRYAALLGSDARAPLEGFCATFPDGLGFLARDEQVWIGGTLGAALREDPRFALFASINESRSRLLGPLEENEAADLLAAAACVIVPSSIGTGARPMVAEAIASGRAVIATPHALRGYGPVVEAAAGRGIHEAATPAAFRALLRQALREGLPGCAPEVRAMVGLDTLAEHWSRHAGALLAETAAP